MQEEEDPIFVQHHMHILLRTDHDEHKAVVVVCALLPWLINSNVSPRRR